MGRSPRERATDEGECEKCLPLVRASVASRRIVVAVSKADERAERTVASRECRDDGGPAACKDLAPVPATRHSRGVRRIGHDDGNPQLEVVVRA